MTPVVWKSLTSAKRVPVVLNEKTSWFELSIRRRRAQSSPTPKNRKLSTTGLLDPNETMRCAKRPSFSRLDRLHARLPA
jgi:hypothetical protein